MTKLDGKIAHSKLGASSTGRWMNCPGSVEATKDYPETTNIYAAEGTAAHSIGDACLKSHKDADEYLGNTIAVDEWEFEVNREMVTGVQMYLDVVRNDMEEIGSKQIYAEQRVDLSRIHPGMFGTSDAILIKDRLLKVYDLKYGRGVVEVRENTQALFYAVGALLLMDKHKDVAEIEMVIVQPRVVNPIKRWTVTRQYLKDWIVDLKSAAEATTAKDAPRIPGEKQCQFCQHHRLVVILNGDVQWRNSDISCQVDVRGRLDQRLHYRLVALLSCDVQRRRAVIPCLVDVRGRLDQRLHYRLVAVLSGDKQRRPPLFTCLVDVRARLDQRPHHRLVAKFSGDVQPFLVPRAAVRARPLQYLEMPALRRLTTRVCVPRRAVRARPLQHLEVPAVCRPRARQNVPWAAVRAKLLQLLELSAPRRQTPSTSRAVRSSPLPDKGVRYVTDDLPVAGAAPRSNIRAPRHDQM